jgi:hypothetical protein
MREIELPLPLVWPKTSNPDYEVSAAPWSAVAKLPLWLGAERVGFKHGKR